MFKESIKVINGLMEDTDEVVHLFDMGGNHVILTPSEQGVITMKFYCEAEVINMTEDTQVELVDSGFTSGLAVAVTLDGNTSAIIFNEDGELDNNFLGAAFEPEYSYVIDSPDFLEELVEQEDIEEEVAEEVMMLSLF